MTDEASTAGWQDRFEEWVAFAKPLLSQGKDKDAWAKYPWFTTDGDPFAKLDKSVSECRFGLVTTGGYSIEGEQEPMRGFPTFGDEVPQIRHIPLDVDRNKLRINHPGYDHRFAKEDYNANLPLDRLKELRKGATHHKSHNVARSVRKKCESCDGWHLQCSPRTFRLFRNRRAMWIVLLPFRKPIT